MFLGFSAALLAVFPFVICQTSDISITLEIDPCSLTQCAENEECRVVAASDLLQLPVAVCVKTRQFTNRDKCKSFSVGSNILNCRTETEWIIIGDIQCAIRGDSDQTTAQTKVRHVCPGNVGSIRYLAADYKCCTNDDERIDGNIRTNTSSTPSTAITSSLDEPQRLPEDSTVQPQDTMAKPTQAVNGNVDEPADDDATDATLEDTTPFIDVASEAEESDETANDNSSDVLTIETDGYGTVQAYVPILIVFTLIVVLCLVLTLSSCWIIKQSNKKPAKTHPPTVFINPYCDDIKVAYEAPTY